jgi:hypothetical protein
MTFATTEQADAYQRYMASLDALRGINLDILGQRNREEISKEEYDNKVACLRELGRKLQDAWVYWRPAVEWS